MIRRLFTIASVLSLLLCIATIVLWASSRHGGHEYVRAFWTQDQSWSTVTSSPPDPEDTPLLLQWHLGWDRSGIFYRQHTAGFTGDQTYTDRVRQRLEQMAPRDQVLRGWDIAIPDPFAASRGLNGGAWGSGNALGLSYGQAVFVLLLLPITWAMRAALRSRHRRAERRIGLCPVCQYDLRASVGRCPECGTPTPIKMKA